MDNRRYVVYRHIFTNGKSYIGITCVKPYYYRWRAGSSYKSQPKMYNAISKYGWDNIQHEILFDDLSQEEANLKEQEMIEKYNSIDNGYNVSIGGGGTYGIPCSDEAVLHFDSCTEASKHLGVSKSCIARCAKGGRKTSAGYVWRYDNDNI